MPWSRSSPDSSLNRPGLSNNLEARTPASFASGFRRDPSSTARSFRGVVPRDRGTSHKRDRAARGQAADVDAADAPLLERQRPSGADEVGAQLAAALVLLPFLPLILPVEKPDATVLGNLLAIRFDLPRGADA